MRRLHRSGIDDVERAVVLQTHLDRFPHVVAPLRRIFFRPVAGAVPRHQSPLPLLIGEPAVAPMDGLQPPRIASQPVTKVRKREEIRIRSRRGLPLDLSLEIAFDHSAILLEERLVGQYRRPFRLR